MEIPIKMDDLGVPPFSETPISESYLYKLHKEGTSPKRPR